MPTERASTEEIDTLPFAELGIVAQSWLSGRSNHSAALSRRCGYLKAMIQALNHKLARRRTNGHRISGMLSLSLPLESVNFFNDDDIWYLVVGFLRQPLSRSNSHAVSIKPYRNGIVSRREIAMSIPNKWLHRPTFSIQSATMSK